MNYEINKKLSIQVRGQDYIKKNDKEISELIDSCVKNIIQLGKCPTCMSDLNPSHMDKIRKELTNL